MHKKRLLIGMCSWSAPKLLKACVDSLIESLDMTKDGIAVVLNEADNESVQYLHDLKIPFVAVAENRGELAIDYLKPFVENSDYFINSNDDMIYHAGFADDLISIIEENYPCSASCVLVENFNSNNPSVYVDEELTDFYDLNIQNKYKKNASEGKYKRSHKTCGYMHPICVKSVDYLESGGYSGNWDMDFFSGYGRDDMFAATLYGLHKGDFRFITSKNSSVYHASSATNIRKPQKLREQGNEEAFNKRCCMSMHQFKSLVGVGSVIE
jgi:hypothetical protein